MGRYHFGTLPPRLGGISVYLYRLSKLYPKDRFIDTYKITEWKFIWLLCTVNGEIVLHGQMGKRWFYLWLTSWLRHRPYSVVLHGVGWETDYVKANRVQKWCIEKSLKGCRSIQTVGVHIQTALLQKWPELSGKIFVQNAFLPPPLEDEARIWASYEAAMLDFMKSHRPLIVANAFRLSAWRDGTELYGLDMCVEMMRRLCTVYPGAGLLFALADAEYRADYLAEMKQRIAAYGLTDAIYFMTGQKELWPIFKKADLMVRPTCTDGYGVSVREALYFGCPAVASDVCPRPEGTILFPNRNDAAFYTTVMRTLSDTFRKN